VTHRLACGIGLVVVLLLCPRAASAQTIPSVLPLLSLNDGTLFPGLSEEVQIIELRSRQMVEEALAGNHIVGLVTMRPDSAVNERGWHDLFPIGTVCIIDNASRLADGRLFIVIRAVVKFRIEHEETDRVYRTARVEMLPETVEDGERDTLHQLRARVDELSSAVDPVQLPDLTDADRINALAFYGDFDLFERQELLERDGYLARAQALIDLLTMKLAARR
jgi:ATP-dependent Lon protease